MKKVVKVLLIILVNFFIIFDVNALSNNAVLDFRNSTFNLKKQPILLQSSSEVVRIEEDENNPIKKIYNRNEDIDLVSNVIKVIYSDDSYENIILGTSGVTISGYDSSVLGTQVVTISYAEKDLEITVSVKYEPIITTFPSQGGVSYNMERTFRARVTSIPECLGTLTITNENPENVIVTTGETTQITEDLLNTDITIGYKGNAYSQANALNIDFIPNDTDKCFEAPTKQFNVTVSRVSQTISLTEKTDIYYNGQSQPANEAVSNGNGQITYSYYNGTSCSGTPTLNAPINVGAYSVKATASETPQYTEAISDCVKHRILKSETEIVADQINKVYNGHPQDADTFIGRFLNTDIVIQDGNYSYEYYDNPSCSNSPMSESPTNVGTYGVKISLAETSNYYGTETACVPYVMQPYEPIINIEPKTAEYTGQSIVANTASVLLLNNDIYNGNIEYNYYYGSNCNGESLPEAPVNVGNYSVKASIEADGNYSASSKCVTHIITKTNSTLSLDKSNMILTYKTPKTNTYTYTGDGYLTCESSNPRYATCIVNESESNIAVTPVNKIESPVTITVALSDGPNYYGTTATFTVVVNPFKPIVSLTEKNAIYTGSTVRSNTATVTLTNDEIYKGPISYTYYTNDDCSGTVLSAPPVIAGNYSVKAGIDAHGNYTAATSNCTLLTINKSDTTTNLNDITKIFNNEEQSASGATSKLKSNDISIQNGTYKYEFYSDVSCTSSSKMSTLPKNVNKYGVKAILLETNNYNSSTSNCALFEVKGEPKFELPKLVVDNENNVLKNIPAGTTAKELFDTTKYNLTLEIYSKDDKLVYSSTEKDNKVILTTGSYVKYYDRNGQQLYKISILGDTSGDGKVNYTDYVNIYNHIKKTKHPESNQKLLEKEYYVSADMNNDDKISYGDYVLVYNYIKESKKN